LWIVKECRTLSLARIRKDLVDPGTEISVFWGSFSGEPKWEIRSMVTKLPFIPEKRKMELAK